MVEGGCLCGAVRVRARPLGGVSACHCELCRRWSGSVFAGFEADRIEIEGEVATYRSSSFAERAWCPACGTAVYFRDDGETAYELSPGLFAEAGDWPLAREVYADRARTFRLAGEHERASAQDYEAEHRHVTGDV